MNRNENNVDYYWNVGLMDDKMLAVNLLNAVNAAINMRWKKSFDL